MNSGDAQLPVHMRADLEVIPRVRSGKRERWIANPISGKVVRISEADFQIMSRTAEFSQWRGNELGGVREAIFAQAGQHGLLANIRPGRPVQPRWYHNPLYVKLPGVPADRLASFLAARSGLFFSRLAVCCWSVVFAITAIAIGIHADRLRQSIDGLLTFQSQHWLLAISILAATKVIHELAHAAVCRRMGARCKELGALLLFGTPCLYCDVSDSWRISSPVNRAAVMLAGIYVEWILASVAAWVWLLAEDPLWSLIGFHVLLVCGVSTFVFNINPLMRYDGYYVLSDMLQVNNLRQRAAEAWESTVVRKLVGMSYTAPSITRSWMRNCILSCYYAASYVYSFVVAGAISGWVLMVSIRAGIEPLGRTLIAVVVVASVISMTRPLLEITAGKGGWRTVSKLRRWTIATAVVATLIGMLFIPVDRRIAADGWVDYANSMTVYAPEFATVKNVYLEFGDSVEEGEAIAELNEPSINVDIVRSQAIAAQLSARWESLSQRSVTNGDLREQLASHKKSLDGAKLEKRQSLSRKQSLTLQGTQSGTILRPSMVQSNQKVDQEESGLWLKDRLGQTIRPGEVWCRIGNENDKSVLLHCDASARRFIEVGDQVRLLLGQSTGSVIQCTIDSISMVQHTEHESMLSSSDEFIVSCRLPKDVAEIVRADTQAKGVFRGESFCLWDVLVGQVLGYVS